ncbi:hypothetical protein PoMZ_05035 [Pyricularia oryzae]|uniref:PD-(D/E)XK nuclease-like domain-containing protein n=1 Tax=Pyricularia oryzae TaxID=318829 RepID=A0A4V1C6J1_PYROR|nr:hypothetical protein PoMZ_05035 [Pyricularia oryzae]
MIFIKCHRTLFHDCLHCRVEDWIGRTSNTPDKNKCCSNPHDFEMPPSPPVSSKRTSSPSKRRRPDDKVPINFDFDITPRPSRHLVFDIDELAMLEKPIRIKKPFFELLPIKARELYNSVFRMVDFAIAIVPIEAERAFGEYVRIAELPPTIFKGQKDVAKTKREFESLFEIVADANKCFTKGLSEFFWNIKIYAPLFKFAIRKTPGVSRYEIIFVRVLNLCLPPFGDGATCEFPKSYVAPPFSVSFKSTSSIAASRKKDNYIAAGKMVDFGLFMETKSTAFEKAISALILQLKQRSVNYSNYNPFRSLFLGVNIETKSPGAANNGLVQLALWTAICEIPMGDTIILTGAYKMLGVLRLFIHWVNEDLKKWFEKLLLRA